MKEKKKVALVAHDNMKRDLAEWVEWNCAKLSAHHLVCTGTTGKMVERTLREMYLTNFEIAIKEGKPGFVMTAYNRVNGVYANESRHLLGDILRGEWGFDGAVVTDWGGSNDHALGVQNGSTLEMPAPGGDAVRELMQAVQSGKITEAERQNRILLRKVMKTAGFRALPSEWWHFNFCSRDVAKQKYKLIP